MLIKQSDVARLCGVSSVTVRNWEQRGLLSRAKTPRPGAWYEESDIRAFFLSKDTQVVRVASGSKTI